MAEVLEIQEGTKREQYEGLLPQIKALVEDEEDVIANLANISAALKQQFDWFWVGFYVVKENQLVVGPFQGPIACTRIDFGKGVCGSSWKQEKTLIVDDVDQHSNHIACNPFSRSEIVVPIFKDQEVVAVLDVDSDRLSNFDEVDKEYLEKLVQLIRF